MISKAQLSAHFRPERHLGGRAREFILRKQILALKRVLANKTMAELVALRQGFGQSHGFPSA
jgi:hypothetical protein